MTSTYQLKFCHCFFKIPHFREISLNLFLGIKSLLGKYLKVKNAYHKVTLQIRPSQFLSWSHSLTSEIWGFIPKPLFQGRGGKVEAFLQFLGIMNVYRDLFVTSETRGLLRNLFLSAYLQDFPWTLIFRVHLMALSFPDFAILVAPPVPHYYQPGSSVMQLKVLNAKIKMI